MEENENGNAQRFLELIRRSRRGKNRRANRLCGDSRSSRDGGHARRFARDSPQESLL